MLLHPARPWDLRPTDEDRPQAADPARWPALAVLVPARNEAEALPRTLPALLAQDYPGDWRVVVVDDRSADGTGAIARRLGGGDPRLTVVAGRRCRPAGRARSGRSSRAAGAPPRRGRPSCCC